MISVTGLHKQFRSDEVETAAVSDVSLTIESGEFVAIMGQSGSGKSTLLSLLGLLDRPTAGSYQLLGEETVNLADGRLAQLRRDHIGFVFQSFNLIEDLTVAENVELGLTYRGLAPAVRRKRAADAMDQVGIGHRARHFPHQLSGGQQQRAAIARAIASAPPIILADEPTGNLDTRNGAHVMDILRDLNDAGATIIMVTHSRAQADQARRVVSMQDGRLYSALETLM